MARDVARRPTQEPGRVSHTSPINIDEFGGKQTFAEGFDEDLKKLDEAMKTLFFYLDRLKNSAKRRKLTEVAKILDLLSVSVESSYMLFSHELTTPDPFSLMHVVDAYGYLLGDLYWIEKIVSQYGLLSYAGEGIKDTIDKAKRAARRLTYEFIRNWDEEKANEELRQWYQQKSITIERHTT